MAGIMVWQFARTGELPHHDAAHVEGMDESSASPNVTPLPVGTPR